MLTKRLFPYGQLKVRRSEFKTHFLAYIANKKPEIFLDHSVLYWIVTSLNVEVYVLGLYLHRNVF